jgi:CheY-like chemotaxis protein
MSDPAEGRKTLLIVEDEAVLRQTVAAELGERFCVSQAADGLEAITFLATHEVDLVLTDFRMPRMDGLSLIQAIRQRWPKTKVVLCTRNPGRDNLQRIRALKVDALIEKPFTVEEITRIIEHLMAEGDDQPGCQV